MAKFILINGIRIASEFKAATHGRMTAIGPAFRIGRHSKQVFECECGNVIVALVDNVKHRHNVSCGCYRKEVVSSRSTKHGLCGHSLYWTWVGMIQRCYNPNCARYQDYGGRGIAVCDRWRENFANFLSDMGERPKGCTLDRIDNSIGYEPSNCRWATREEQANNTRGNRMLTFNGKTQTIAQWSRELGLPKNPLCIRIRNGWSVERALSEPVRGKRKAK